MSRWRALEAGEVVSKATTKTVVLSAVPARAEPLPLPLLLLTSPPLPLFSLSLSPSPPCPTLPPLLPPRPLPPRPPLPPRLPRLRRRRRRASRARRPTLPPLPLPLPPLPTAQTRTPTRASTSRARPRTTASPSAPSSRRRRPVSSPRPPATPLRPLGLYGTHFPPQCLSSCCSLGTLKARRERLLSSSSGRLRVGKTAGRVSTRPDACTSSCARHLEGHELLQHRQHARTSQDAVGLTRFPPFPLPSPQPCTLPQASSLAAAVRPSLRSVRTPPSRPVCPRSSPACPTVSSRSAAPSTASPR